jgi:hypothetical protein
MTFLLKLKFEKEKLASKADAKFGEGFSFLKNFVVLSFY